VNPTTNSLSPSAGLVGQTVVISGADFGSTQGSGTVKFGTLDSHREQLDSDVDLRSGSKLGGWSSTGDCYSGFRHYESSLVHGYGWLWQRTSAKSTCSWNAPVCEYRRRTRQD